LRAELKALDSPDVDLESYVPQREAFCVAVTAHIGPVGEAGAELFNFDVCSPQWLEQLLLTDTVISGRHMLFMDGFRLRDLEAYIAKKASQADGPNWATVAERLSRWGYWEFEDYSE